jgi:hypothetical protein
VVLSGEGADEVLEAICILNAFSRGFQEITIESFNYLQPIYVPTNQLWRKV